MSLSPAVRSCVSELSCATNVFHIESLVNIVKFFNSVDEAQLNYACRGYSNVETLDQLVGVGCSVRTVTMMQSLIQFLIRCYADSR